MFQTMYSRACGTRSSTRCKCVPVRLAIHASWCATGGPGGISPKYFSAFASAVLASMSPASASTVFDGP